MLRQFFKPIVAGSFLAEVRGSDRLNPAHPRSWPLAGTIESRRKKSSTWRLRRFSEGIVAGSFPAKSAKTVATPAQTRGTRKKFADRGPFRDEKPGKTAGSGGREWSKMRSIGGQKRPQEEQRSRVLSRRTRSGTGRLTESRGAVRGEGSRGRCPHQMSRQVARRHHTFGNSNPLRYSRPRSWFASLSFLKVSVAASNSSVRPVR